MVKLRTKQSHLVRLPSSIPLPLNDGGAKNGFGLQIGKIKALMQSVLFQGLPSPLAFNQLKTIFKEIESLEKAVERDYERRLKSQIPKHLSPQTLHYLAFHDSLTHLPNRHYFRSIVQELLNDAPFQLYLAFLDLDGFKKINDAYGHEMGDWLLVEVARRLKHSLRKTDLVCRYGGDEFVILFQSYEKQEALLPVIRRVLESVCEPFHRDNIVLKISASMGVASLMLQGNTFEDLLHRADAAMYRAKLRGKNSFCFWHERAN